MRIFILYVWSVALLSVVKAGVLARTEIKQECQQTHRRPIRFLGQGPRRAKGHLGGGEIGDILEVEIDTEEDLKHVVSLRRQHLNRYAGFNDKSVSVYTDRNIILRHVCPVTYSDSHDDDNCDMDTTCKQYAIIRGRERSIYVNGNGEEIAIPDRPGIPRVAIPGEDLFANTEFENDIAYHEKQRITINSDDVSESRHKRASLMSGVVQSKVIKLVMFADKGLIDWFLPSNGNDVIAAQQDIITYLSLITNEMTLHYQTLKEYGRTLTVNGMQTTMDIFVGLLDVIFPPAGSISGNFDWLANNVVGDTLNAYRREQARAGLFMHTGVLEDFRQFLKTYTYSKGPYDHAMLVTGYALKETTIYNSQPNFTTNLVGTAWLGSMCSEVYTKAGLHSSVVEFDARLSRTAAHELGHSFGMRHDIDHGDFINCPNSQYVMSSNIISPSESISGTYHKFSMCSANDVQQYTARISSADFVPTCLAPQNVFFLLDFCKGVSGTTLSFDEQCALRYGKGSRRASASNFMTEMSLLLGYVEHCIADDTGVRFPFLCTAPDLQDRLYKAPEAAAGTRCVGSDGSRALNICYQGQCVDQLKIC